VAEYFASQDLDSLLGEGRRGAGAELKARMQASVDDPALDLGIEIVQVGLTQVHPPQNEGDEEAGTEPVPEAFHEQIAALQEKESAKQLARQEEAKILSGVAGSRDNAERLFAAIEHWDALKNRGTPPADVVAAEAEIKRLLEEQAGGTAAKVINDAWAYRWSKAIGARGEADRFRAELLSYEAAPKYYRQRAYFNTLAENVPGTRIFVYPHAGKDNPSVIQVDFQDTASTLPGILEDE
jgi:regulator of protease activity HflC (stomatin/prohibitin superfamily)